MASHPVRIGAALHPQHAEYDQIRRAAVEVEELGADAVFNWDHFFPLSGDPDGKHFEAWTVLASWAEVTEGIEFGPLVSCNSYRNPDLLADMARTVDHIAGGSRLIFGIGAGWFRKDYDEYGFEFSTAGSRLEDLRRALPRIKSRWEKLNPAPVRDIPVMIGGGGEKKTLRYTAEHADIWHGFGDPDVIRHKNEVLDAYCADMGRDPGEIERSCGAKAIDLDRADDYLDAGATFITLGFDGADGYDLAALPDWLAWRDERNAC